MGIAGDSLYSVSYVPTWADTGPIGHVTIRRLDDRVVVAQVPALDGDEAEALLARAEHEVRGDATAFEAAWAIRASDIADPGPDVIRGDVPAQVAEREPDDGQRVRAADARVRVLPEADTVFPADQAWLSRVLHPLVSIDLASVGIGDGGWVTVVSPVEPVEGLIGERTASHHDDATGENWISFRLDGGRMRFLGEREFFEIESGAYASDPEVIEAYADAEREYVGGIERYRTVGALVWGDEDDPTRQRADWGTDIAIVDLLGGNPGFGNWTAFPPPAAYRLDESDPAGPVLRLADGRPFTFVAATAGYPWRETGADAILVFVEPETRTAVLTFDWT